MSPTQLITEYDRQIRRTAHGLLHRSPRDFELDDLIQYGRICIWKNTDKILAIEDPLHRWRYVRLRIFGAMVDAMRTGHMGPRKSGVMVYGLDEELYELHFGARDEPYGMLLCKEVLERAAKRLTKSEQAYLVWLLEVDDGTTPYHTGRGISPSRVSQYRKTIEALFASQLQSFTETDRPARRTTRKPSTAWAPEVTANPVTATALAAWHRYSRKTP